MSLFHNPFSMKHIWKTTENSCYNEILILFHEANKNLVIKDMVGTIHCYKYFFQVHQLNSPLWFLMGSIGNFLNWSLTSRITFTRTHIY